MKQTYFNIPLDLCYYAVRNKKFRLLRLYLLLKQNSNGILRLETEAIQELTKKIGYKSVRSLFNNLDELINMNWVGYNSRSRFYFIRSFNNVLSQLNIAKLRRKGALLKYEHIENLEAFLISVILEDLYTKIRWKKRQELAREFKKGRAFQVLADSIVYVEISCKYLAKVLDISISTAYKYKQLAFKSGMIDIMKNIKPLNVSPVMLFHINKSVPEYKGRFRKHGGGVGVVCSDKVRTNIKLLRRKKTNDIKKGVYKRGASSDDQIHPA